MFESYPPFRATWQEIEKLFRREQKGDVSRQQNISLAGLDSGSAILSKAELIEMTMIALDYFELMRKRDREFVRDIARDRRALPSDEASDRVLRAEAAIERS